MTRYYFIFGRYPYLSLLELTTVLDGLNVKYECIYFSVETAILEIEKKIDVFELINSLGGIVKIGEVLDDLDLNDKVDKFEAIFSAENLSLKYLPQISGKNHLGISIYKFEEEDILVYKLQDKLKELYLDIKTSLKEIGVKIGFLQTKSRMISSVSVVKNNLLRKGVEIVILVGNKKMFIGKTLCVQNFEMFSILDMDRPCRDKKSGIMPPKLARMMINLLNLDKNQTLLDPFCGSGTIIQEAVVLGFKSLIGADISSQALSNTQKNINWLFQQFTFLKRDNYQIKLVKADVGNLSTFLKENEINAIVSEPFLGPALFRRPTIQEMRNTLTSLSALYFKAFLQFKKIIKTNAKLVIIFPCFEINDTLYFIDILKKLEDLGFRQNKFDFKKWGNNQSKMLSPRGSILFLGKDQFLIREILSFEYIK